jgi:hypothetical protein
MAIAGANVHGENHEKYMVQDTFVIHDSSTDYGFRPGVIAGLRQQVDTWQRSFDIARQQLLAA